MIARGTLEQRATEHHELSETTLAWNMPNTVENLERAMQKTLCRCLLPVPAGETSGGNVGCLPSPPPESAPIAVCIAWIFVGNFREF